MTQHIKRWKNHIQAIYHKVILNSKAFTFFSDQHIWRKPIQEWPYTMAGGWVLMSATMVGQQRKKLKITLAKMP